MKEEEGLLHMMSLWYLAFVVVGFALDFTIRESISANDV
jgi:hypothetical protein